MLTCEGVQAGKKHCTLIFLRSDKGTEFFSTGLLQWAADENLASPQRTLFIFYF